MPKYGKVNDKACADEYKHEGDDSLVTATMTSANERRVNDNRAFTRQNHDANDRLKMAALQKEHLLSHTPI